MAQTVADVDGLFTLPVEDFTAARNALAKRFDKEGRSEEASEVKALKKPKLSAWAINQLAHGHTSLLEELVSVSREMAAATEAGEMRTASIKRQRLVSQLRDRAGSILEQGGHAAAANTLHEVTQTLLATSDEDLAEAVLQGRLSEPLRSSGFFFLAGDVELQEPAPSETKEDKEKIQKIERLEEDLERAKRIASEKRIAADKARERAGQAEEAATEALAEVERLEEQLIDLKG